MSDQDRQALEEYEAFLERASELMETVKGGDCGPLWDLVSDMAIAADRRAWATPSVPVNVPHHPRPGEVYAFGPTQEAR